MKARPNLPVFLLFGLAPLAALASTVVQRTLAEHAKAADRVAMVQVIDQRTEATGDPAHPTLKTYTRVLVGEEYKGSGPKETTIVQLGGRSGPWEMHVPGDATLVLGETALVFLRCASPERCFLVGLESGHLPMVAGGKLRRHDLATGRWETHALQDVASMVRATAPVEAPALRAVTK